MSAQPPPIAQDSESAAAGQDWLAANHAVIRAGIGWAKAVLSGGDHAAARQEFERLRETMAQAQASSALDRLAEVFDLAPADEDCLIFALAHRMDGEVPALCAAAAGDPRQTFVTAHLLTRAVGGSDAAFNESLLLRLTPDAPLRRYALIEVREMHALAGVSIEETVARRLLGTSSGVDGRHTGLSAVPWTPRLERLQRVGSELGERLARGAFKGVALVGRRGSGRLALAREIALAAGMAPMVLDVNAVPNAVEGRAAFWRSLDRQTRLDDVAVIIDVDSPVGLREAAPVEEAPGFAEGGLGRMAAREAVQALGGALIVLARDSTGLPPACVIYRSGPLDAREREALWRAAIAPAGAERMMEARAVAEHFPLGPHQIAAIASAFDEHDRAGTIWNRCRIAGGHDLERLAERVVPRFTWNDLVLPEAVLAEFKAVADQVRHRTKVYDQWGFGARLSSGRGITALFAGPSGVGKSMAAEVIAGELALDLYRVDLSRLVSKYIGETEKNLKRVFDAAEETGACLFLDEADACLGKRSEVKDSHDRYANTQVSYLLQRMESYTGLCLMATNMKNNLDGAFLRRLRFVIDVPFPDQGLRYRIWQHAFPPATPTEGLDLTALSRLDIAGGSIVVIAVNAAFLAAAEGGPVTMDRIARAARGEFRKHERVFRATW
jgi:hypothetical protein